MKRITKLFTLITISFLSPNIFSFSISQTPYGNIVKWKNLPIQYYLDPDGVDDISDGSDIEAMYDSFKDWEEIKCSDLSFKDMGVTTNTDILPIGGYTNGKNELVFIEDSKWKHGKYVLGITAPIYYYDGKIIEADIAFNGYLMQWSTKGDIYKADVKSVVIHEIGHLFGLGHVLGGYNPYNPPTMAPTADPFLQSRTLEEDDKKGACFLYPAGGVYKCSNDNDCPYVIDQNQNGEEYYTGKFTCKNGNCALGGVIPEKKKLGETCTNSGECKDPYFCQPVQGGKSYCSTNCDPQKQNCPSGFKCYPYSNASGGACLPDSGQTTKKNAGESCSSSYECITGLCFPNPDQSGMFCRIPCKKGGGECPSGEVCVTIGTSSNGACLKGGPQKKKTGEVCKNDNECESGICFGTDTWLCRESCNPKEQKCSIGYYCKDLGNGVGGCLPGTPPPPPKKDDGALCINNNECKSNLCYNLIGTGKYFCRTPCILSQPACPEGNVCISYEGSENGVCMPQKNGHGEGCESQNDCTSAICWEGKEGKYCTLNCINGQCEEGYLCQNGTFFGDICIKIEKILVDENIPDAFIGNDKFGQEVSQKKEEENGGGWCNFNINNKFSFFNFLIIFLFFIFSTIIKRNQYGKKKPHNCRKV